MQVVITCSYKSVCDKSTANQALIAKLGAEVDCCRAMHCYVFDREFSGSQDLYRWMQAAVVDRANTALALLDITAVWFELLKSVVIITEGRTQVIWMCCCKGTFPHTATWQLLFDVQYGSISFWQRSAAQVASQHATASWISHKRRAWNAAKYHLRAGMSSQLRQFTLSPVHHYEVGALLIF